MKQNSKPWLSNRGRHLATDKIKEICGSWDLKTWESYAGSLDSDNDGVLMTARRLYRSEEYPIENIFKLYAQNFSSLELTKLIEDASTCLTTRQAHVVDLIFVQGKSLSEVGEIIGLGKTTVFDHLHRALARLRAHLSVRADALIEVRGKNNHEAELLSREEQIFEVFNQESHRCDGNIFGLIEGIA